jgi:hypothetical protein
VSTEPTERQDDAAESAETSVAGPQRYRARRDRIVADLLAALGATEARATDGDPETDEKG